MGLDRMGASAKSSRITAGQLPVVNTKGIPRRARTSATAAECRVEVDRGTDDLIAEVLYNALHRGCDNSIVLHDEDTSAGIERHFGLLVRGKVTHWINGSAKAVFLM
jgi:hypothetical protein